MSFAGDERKEFDEVSSIYGSEEDTSKEKEMVSKGVRVRGQVTRAKSFSHGGNETNSIIVEDHDTYADEGRSSFSNQSSRGFNFDGHVMSTNMVDAMVEKVIPPNPAKFHGLLEHHHQHNELQHLQNQHHHKLNASDIIEYLHENTLGDKLGKLGKIHNKKLIFEHINDKSEMDTSLSRRAKVSPNPLKLFPAKHDNIIHSFFGVDESKKIPKVEQRDKFTNQTPVQPPARSFRRMNGLGNLFTVPDKQQVPLSDLHVFREEARRNFVLVEESRLTELTRLENSLREEKNKIALAGEKTNYVLSDFQVEPRIPLPATRLAIHNVCEDEMRKLAAEINRLNVNWTRFCKDNHYENNPIYTKDAFEARGPLHIRALKVRLAKEAAEKYSVRRDRDTMMFEDDMSFFVGKYYDAQSRKRDYDRYYILANRYKPFSEHEYQIDGSPGKRYFLKVLDGALKFQRAWDKFWGVRRVKRFYFARKVQCKWRKYCARKNVYPIIKLRIRVGPRTYYIFCMHLWREYIRIIKAIKNAINFKLENYQRVCFEAWAKWARSEVDRKNAVKKRLAMRMKFAPVIAVIITWSKWAKRSKFIKKKCRRIFSRVGLYYDTWCLFTAYSKKLKKQSKTATILQALARMFSAKNRYRKMRRGVKVLCKFAIQVLCHASVKRRRESLIWDEFLVWKPEELDRRTLRANEDELRRLQRQQLGANEKGKKAIIDIKKHLNSVNGSAQLGEIRREVWSEASVIDRLRIGTVSERAEKVFLERVKRANHILGKHDFNAKFRPFVVCAVPSCCRTFTDFKQYREHEDTARLDENHSLYLSKTNESVYWDNPKYLTSFVEFHKTMIHPKGLDTIKLYVTRIDGLGAFFNCADAWSLIQDWKRTETTNKLYTSRGMSIYETFFRFDATRRIDITYDGFEKHLEAFEHVRSRDSDGFMRPTRATRSLFRTVLQVSAQPYVEWTERNQIQPDAFLQIEFFCFYKLFSMLSRDPEFLSSQEYKEFEIVLELEAKQRELDLLNDYKIERNGKYMTWAKEYLRKEKQMAKLSYISVDQFMDLEVERYISELCLAASTNKTRTIRNNEQKVREKTTMLADDGADWCIENTTEYVFDYFVTKLINKMWTLPQYRDGFLEYVGLRKVVKRKLVVDKNARNKKGEFDWYDKLLVDEFAIEKATFVLTRKVAIVRVQRRVRGLLARKKVRKLVAKNISKVWDEESQGYVYKNKLVNENMYDQVTTYRPLLISRLFPNSTW